MVSVRSAVYDLRQCRCRLEKILAAHQGDVLVSSQVTEAMALVGFMRYLEEIYADQATYDERKAEWSSSEADLES